MIKIVFAFASGGSGEPACACIALRCRQPPAWAQDTRAGGPIRALRRRPPTRAPAGQDAGRRRHAADEGAIVVTGFRASLQSAVNTKKRADQIVELVSAEDIGKLPDASIGESIARLPGLTSQRLSRPRERHLDPRLRPGLLDDPAQRARTDVDRRQPRRRISTNIPSEIISQVNVYKTPMASHHRPGHRRHGRPAHRSARSSSASASSRSAPAASIRTSASSIPDVNEIRLSRQRHLRRPVRRRPRRHRARGQLDRRTVPDQGIQLPGATLDVRRHGNVVDRRRRSPYSTSTDLKRLGLTGTLEFKPTPTTSPRRSTASIRTSRTTRSSAASRFRSGGAAAAKSLQPGFTVADGVDHVRHVQQCRTPSSATSLQPRHAKLYSFGWNNRFDGDNGWHGFADISYSKTNRNELIFETYAGTGCSSVSGPRDTFGFDDGDTRHDIHQSLLDYSDSGPDLA